MRSCPLMVQMHSRYCRIGIFLSFLLVLWPMATTRAQSSGSTTGSIVGIVNDLQGAALVGATITVRQIETNLVRTVEVDSDGSYQFLQLPPGEYEIKAQAEGFS